MDEIQNISQPIAQEADFPEESLQDLKQSQEHMGQTYYVDGNNGNDESKGFDHNLTVKLDVGEKVSFIVGKNNNDEFDLTEWNPTVTLTQLSERLELEGENGIMKGVVKEALRNASQGKIAGFFGNGADNDVTYTVQVAHTGEYAIKLHVVAGEKRSVFCDVNGTPASKVEFPAGEWWAVQQAAPMIVTLKEEENTIRFYNDLAYAPALTNL